MHTWTARKPAVPGWYWTRRKIEDETSEYYYDVLRVEERWPGPALVDADDPFFFPLDHDSYSKYEWAGPMKPPS